MGYFMCDLIVNGKLLSKEDDSVVNLQLIYLEKFRRHKGDPFTLAWGMSVNDREVSRLYTIDAIFICDENTFKVTKIDVNTMLRLYKTKQLLAVYNKTIYCMSVDGYRLSKLLDYDGVCKVSSFEPLPSTMQAQFDRSFLLTPTLQYNKFWFNYKSYLHSELMTIQYEGLAFICDYILYLLMFKGKDVFDTFIRLDNNKLIVYGAVERDGKLFLNDYVSLIVNDVRGLKALLAQLKLRG